ncbi:glutathione S-transferase family protein [Massilia sp. CMS3.1]|uniref:glutathione S-transferase family protein n=1 Tax=Massilia sp. CMS3.1 TaxID=3373083 RepID=UPI003EE42988
MKLYWGPHTCAIGIHILLEETGAQYETEKLDIERGDTKNAPFVDINPKGKVPTLVCNDGTVLTEFGAIATWLARTYPEAHLLLSSPMEEARAVEVLEYVEGTIHGQGYARMINPKAFAPMDAVQEAQHLGRVKQQGKEIIDAGFAILDKQLRPFPFAVGNKLSIADAALFYVERWAPGKGITLPPNVQAHFEHMLARPAVQKVLAFWGER